MTEQQHMAHFLDRDQQLEEVEEKAKRREDEDDDTATEDSLDGLVASVVDDSLGESAYDFDLEAVRSTSAPLPLLPSNNSGSASSAANSAATSWMDEAVHGLTQLSLSSPNSPSNSSRLRSSFDFASSAAAATAAAPRFQPPPPAAVSPKSGGGAGGNSTGLFGQYAMFSHAASSVTSNTSSREEDELQMQIQELQQKLHWQQQQRASFKPPTPPPPSQDWSQASFQPQYSPVHAGSRLYPPTFAATTPAFTARQSPSHASAVPTPTITPPPSLSTTTVALPSMDKLLLGDAPLASMEGRFLQLAQEQNGCRYLQSRIAKEGSSGAHLVLLEVFVHLVDLMTDPFANYMYQKLLDVATPEQRLAMLEQVRHSLLSASLNLHGTRSVQKHIEVASQQHQHANAERQRQILAQELSPHVTKLSMDTNGNHVIQRMLQHMRASDCDFIFRAVVHDLILVTRHRHGCCVVQRSLDAARGPQRDMLIERIEFHALQLMQDAFANYTVQYVLEMGLGQRIVQQILGRIEPLSKQKFSSNVVEKCILAASPDQLEMIVQECSACMGNLLRDAFANFVAQKLLEVTSDAQSRRLVAAMRPHLLDLNLSCSRRVVNRVIKRFPDLVGDDVVQQVLAGGGGGAHAMQQQQQQPQFHHYVHHNAQQAHYHMPQQHGMRRNGGGAGRD